jgi:hypothetical protein
VGNDEQSSWHKLENKVGKKHKNQPRDGAANQSSPDDSDRFSNSSAEQDGKGELRYGHRSLALQFAEPTRRFSIVLLDDFVGQCT